MGVTPPVAEALEGSVEHVATWDLSADLGMVAVAFLALLALWYVVRSFKQVFSGEKGTA